MTYHLCAENITKNCIVPNLPDDEKDDLLTRGILPPSSSARDLHCVSVSSEEGLTKAPTMLLMLQLVSPRL